MEIETTDGQTVTHTEMVNRGADERPLSADEITDKFRDNAAMALPAARVDAALEAIMDLDGSASPAGVAGLLSEA